MGKDFFVPMNEQISAAVEREVPLLMQRKPVATLNEYTGKPVMKSAHWAYESAAGGFSLIRPPGIAVHEIPPEGGMNSARCAELRLRQAALQH